MSKSATLSLVSIYRSHIQWTCAEICLCFVLRSQGHFGQQNRKVPNFKYSDYPDTSIRWAVFPVPCTSLMSPRMSIFWMNVLVTPTKAGSISSDLEPCLFFSHRKTSRGLHVQMYRRCICEALVPVLLLASGFCFKTLNHNNNISFLSI